jgi:hypothetical protein
MTVSDLLEQPCNKSDNINKVVTSCLTACSKLVDNLGQAVRTQLVDGLLADFLQDVRFLPDLIETGECLAAWVSESRSHSCRLNIVQQSC